MFSPSPFLVDSSDAVGLCLDFSSMRRWDASAMAQGMGGLCNTLPALSQMFLQDAISEISLVLRHRAGGEKVSSQTAPLV